MKILITESQLEVIISHIKQTNKPNSGVLEEGWKDVVLGTAMLMGFGLSGVNAQTAKNALNNADIIQKIESTLESQEIDKLADTLEKIGLTDALSKIQTNAETIKNNLEIAAKKKGVSSNLQIYNTDKESQIKSKIKQGYAVSDIDVTQDTIWTSEDVVELETSLDVTFDANIFKTASFDLVDSVKNELKNTIESILMMNGNITSIKIESSTDTEPIKMGNEKLAKLRAIRVKDYIDGLNATNNISFNILPEQGPEVYSTTMTPKEREQARSETSKYRYVKVIITSNIKPIPVETPAFKLINKIKVELTKVNNYKAGGIELKGGKKLKPTIKKFKLKKCKVNNKTVKCSFGHG